MKKIWMILSDPGFADGLWGACRVRNRQDGKLHIVATVFPAYDFARAAAGDLADVELLLPPGTESHSYEPTPADILRVQNCDLFLYLGGESDSWVETILDAAEPTGQTLAMIDCVETLEEEHAEGMQEEAGHHHEERRTTHDDHDDHDHLGTVTEIDEHVWTSPANAAAITRRFGEELAALDSTHGAQYRANAEAYAAQIDALDREFHDFFDGLPDRTIVFGDRFPLRYFAEEFRPELLCGLSRMLHPDGAICGHHRVSDGQGEVGAHLHRLVYRVFQPSGGGRHCRGRRGRNRHVPHLPQRLPGGTGAGRDLCDADGGQSGTIAGTHDIKSAAHHSLVREWCAFSGRDG